MKANRKINKVDKGYMAAYETPGLQQANIPAMTGSPGAGTSYGGPDFSQPQTIPQLQHQQIVPNQ